MHYRELSASLMPDVSQLMVWEGLKLMKLHELAMDAAMSGFKDH